ncbi:trimeric intracellular cation channel family protein [Demequina globuliformis]|uniref:trimeric intracellular cation channel family protein n=1 Tax=Demequina globuliformis TaxID=676202 RepID=UPI0007822EAC|nr:trimeric intracellular cation channel family protein [Demequina globuliformis]
MPALLDLATAPDLIDSALGTLRTVLEYIGTVAFAISGAVAAGRKRMDLVGAVVLACMVAIGGGTVRDVILDVPVFWIESPSFLIVGAVTGLAVALLARWHPPDRLGRFRIVQASDAIGLAVFVVVGTGVAIDAGAPLLIAAVMGVLTGVGGGIIRDMLANDVPDVLRNGQFYATAALAGAAVYAVLLWADVPRTVVFWVPMVVILAMRLASIKFGWGVPTVGGKRVDVDAPHGHPNVGHYGG